MHCKRYLSWRKQVAWAKIPISKLYLVFAFFRDESRPRPNGPPPRGLANLTALFLLGCRLGFWPSQPNCLSGFEKASWDYSSTNHIGWMTRKND